MLSKSHLELTSCVECLYLGLEQHIRKKHPSYCCLPTLGATMTFHFYVVHESFTIGFKNRNVFLINSQDVGIAGNTGIHHPSQLFLKGWWWVYCWCDILCTGLMQQNILLDVFKQIVVGLESHLGQTEWRGLFPSSRERWGGVGD